MENELEDFRNHTFSALEDLGGEEKPLEIKCARAMGELAQTVIEVGEQKIELLKINRQATVPGFLQITMVFEAQKYSPAPGLDRAVMP